MPIQTNNRLGAFVHVHLNVLRYCIHKSYENLADAISMVYRIYDTMVRYCSSGQVIKKRF